MIMDSRRRYSVGVFFDRKRATDTYSFSIVAYDNMIYLAKSKVHMVFNNATVTDAVKRVCNEIGISVNGKQSAAEHGGKLLLRMERTALRLLTFCW